MNKRIWGVLALVVLTACGGGSSSSNSAGGSSSISNTVPSDVVISSPTASLEGSLSLSRSMAKGVGDAAAGDFASKREALQALIAGEGECSFTLQMPSVFEPDCYGPVIDFAEHPDGDADAPEGSPDRKDGQLPVGDTGIWDETEGGTEACAAAKMNALIDKVASKVDNLVKIFGSMACAGQKADVDPPAANVSVDLKDEMEQQVDASGLGVESAVLSRLTDDSDGNAVYQSTLTTTMSFQGGSSSDSEIILKHIPTSTDNSTYKGKASIKMTMDTVDDCVGSGIMAGAIIYEKTSESDVSYLFNFADFCGTDTDPFDENNNIDPSGDWVHNWNYGLFDLNPSNGTGTVSYAWQAGTGDGRTRVLNVTTTQADDGLQSGTAYFGYGPPATDENLGTIDGFVYSWAGPHGAITETDRSAAALLVAGKGFDKAQRQELRRASGEAVFAATSSNITYAPSIDGTATSDDSFIYQAVDMMGAGGALLNLGNDRADDAAAVVPNLIDLEEVDFTLPTPPEDVGG